MPYNSSASGPDEGLLAAFQAANPGVTNPSRKALRAFMKRDFEAIMARLDVQIPAAKARMDALIEKLKQPAA